MAYRSGDAFRNAGTYPGASFIPPTPSKVGAFTSPRATTGLLSTTKPTASRSTPNEPKVDRYEYL